MLDFKKFENSLSASLSKERIEQKKIYRKAKDFYENKSVNHKESILKPHFADYDLVEPTLIFRETGMTKSIVDNISLVYQEEPDRMFLDKNGEELSEKISDQINEIYSNLSNRIFQAYEKYVNALSQCSLLLSFDVDEKKIIGRILTPDNYDVSENEYDKTRADAYFFTYADRMGMKNSNKIRNYVYIDKDEIKKVSVSDNLNNNVSEKTAKYLIESSKLNGSESEKNIYKIIPIVTSTSTQQVDSFFVDENARLFSTNQSVLTLKDVSSNDTAFYQGFSLLVKTQAGGGYAESTIKDKTVISSKVMAIAKAGVKGGNESEKYEYVSPSVDLKMLNDDMQAIYLQTASIFGLGESDGNVKVNASGLSLVVSDDKKNKIINASRSIYVKFEKELYEVIKAIANVHGLANIPVDSKISVNFKEIKTSIGVQDTIDQEQHDLDNMLRSQTKILMDRDPELTQEQADRQVLQAIQEKDKLRTIQTTKEA